MTYCRLLAGILCALLVSSCTTSGPRRLDPMEQTFSALANWRGLADEQHRALRDDIAASRAEKLPYEAALC
jgi:hypothetical protein